MREKKAIVGKRAALTLILNAVLMSAVTATTSPSPLFAEESKKPAESVKRAAGSIRVPGTRIYIVPPEGFKQATNFTGYIDPDTNASLMLTEMAAPFSKLSAGYQAEPMKARGMILTSSKSESCCGLLGLTIEFKQSMYGVEFNKTAKLFGDEKTSYLALTTIAADTDAKIAKRLKDAVASITIDTSAKAPGLDEGLTYTVDDGSVMKRNQRLQNALLFRALDEQTGGKNAMLVVAPSIATVKIIDTADFAMKRLKSVDSMTDFKVEKDEAIKVDGLDGREITATARDTKSGTPSLVYQVMLFDPNGYYYIVQGLTPQEMRSKYEKDFAAIARSFKRKKW